MGGSGTTCYITTENRDETLNTEDGRIHHRLTPSSGEDKTLNQASWRSLNMMDLHSFVFNVHIIMLKRTKERPYQTLLKQSHVLVHTPFPPEPVPAPN